MTPIRRFYITKDKFYMYTPQVIKALLWVFLVIMVKFCDFLQFHTVLCYHIAYDNQSMSLAVFYTRKFGDVSWKLAPS